MSLRTTLKSCAICLLCFIGWTHTMPFKMNSETEEKLAKKISALLNTQSPRSDLNPMMEEDHAKAKSQLPVSSDFTKQNPASVEIDQNPKQLMNPNSLESKYSEAVQKMFENAKSPLVRYKENQAVPQTSDDQLSIGTFSRGDSLAMLGTDEIKSEKPEILLGTGQPNVSLNLDKNTTLPIVTSKSINTNGSHKQSAGSKFLASVSPEEFLKRLKKHLEISKSNLKILKRNFHDFLKEKEKLFRMNQKVSQEHPHPKEIKVSIIRADENGQDASFVRDPENSAAFPTAVYPQPISQICPQDCPVNMIHIEHHHHGNSPVPCICENDNLYADMKEDSSFSDFQSFPLKLYKTKLTSNAVQLKENKAKLINVLENIPETKPIEDSPKTNLLSNKKTAQKQSAKEIMNNKLNAYDHMGPFTINSNEIIECVNDMKQKAHQKTRLVNTVPKYYSGCERPTTHIPAACDIACIPCKTPPPESTSCVVCPRTCPSNCQSGSVIKTDPPSNLCPPKCPPCFSPITCPPTCPPTTTKCTTTCPPTCATTCPPTCPPKCPCGKFMQEKYNRDKCVRSRGKRNVLGQSDPKLAALKNDQKIEEGSESREQYPNTAKLTMEDVKCTTPLSCCPTTCPSTCSTTCCTTAACPPDGKSCPSCLCLADKFS